MAYHPTPSDLLEAILGDSPATVARYLQMGLGPNTPLSIPSLHSFGDEGVPNHVMVISSIDDRPGTIPPLHAALVNCRHNYSHNKSLDILRTLVSHGSDLAAEATFRCCHINRTEPIPVGRALHAKGFAHFLKKCDLSTATTCTRRESMDDTLTLFDRLESEASSAVNLKKFPVPQSVCETWTSLLLSEEFSDIHFACSDGTALHAHKCVLAAASPYFRTAFKGPWAENNSEGKWETWVPSDIMKAALSFLYTGKVDKTVAKQHPQAMLALSSEYGLKDLQTLSEGSLIRKLDCENVKEYLLLSHLHGSNILKKACYAFVRQHSIKLLTDPNFTSLETEDEELWDEMIDRINGTRKRRRDDSSSE